MTDIIWKPIPDYEGLYEVSNLGKVRSLDRTLTNKRNGVEYSCFYPGKVLKEDIRTYGELQYRFVALSKNNRRYNVGIHRLVASAFIPNEENKPFVNHKDNNGLNNNVDNLEWVTHSENMLWAQKQGRLYKSQSKAGKVGSLVNRDKLLTKLKAITEPVGTWKILSLDLMTRSKKNYVQCQCIHCGYISWVETGRLLRKEVSDRCCKCYTRHDI